MTSAARPANLTAISVRCVAGRPAARTLFIGNQHIMQNVIRYLAKGALLSATIAVVALPGLAHAQSGSAGGSIGNDEKSLSGSREAPPAAGPSKSAPSSRQRATDNDRLLHPGIIVTSATLGSNCGASRGNVTSQVAEICNGRDVCQLPGSSVNNPDPAFGCFKAFDAQWKCSPNGGTKSAAVSAIANETNVLTLKCN